MQGVFDEGTGLGVIDGEGMAVGHGGEGALFLLAADLFAG